MQVKNIIFDLGGVIMTLDKNEAVRRFCEIGVKNAHEKLDAYTQKGIFGELELGHISPEIFCKELNKLSVSPINIEQCEYAWLGYCKEVPQRNLEKLSSLKKEGYNLILLSNTNPFVMNWALSNNFAGENNSIAKYFDVRYISFECGLMKPDLQIFEKIIKEQKLQPQETLFLDDGENNIKAANKLNIKTLLVKNGEDWTKIINKYI